MAVDFSQFSQKTSAVSTDYLVGYDQNESGGEKKFTLSTIANAVSGIMQSELQSLVNQKAVPTGSVTYYSLSAAPTGWIECNGATLSASMGSSYTNLRTLLINDGYKFGSSGSDPKVPDLRGKFIRSNGSDGTYSSGTFGATQADAVESHTHGIASFTNIQSAFTGPRSGTYGSGDTQTTTQTTGQTPAGSTETRPANLALLACIKL